MKIKIYTSPTEYTEKDLDLEYADRVHYHDDRYYTETEVNNLLSGKLGTSQNAASASKLLNTRYLSISGGATGSSTGFDGSGNASIPITEVKEAYLSWGGKNHSASYGPIDAAMVGELGANRLAFLPGESTIVEYSQDGGVTWLDYGCENYTKINIFNGNGSNLAIGKNTSKDVDYSNFQLRITINTAGKVYSTLNKFVILCSTSGSGGSWCTIDARLQSNYEADIDTWKMLSENTPINGWSGYNVINIPAFTTYGNTPTSQYGQVRLTFGCTTANLSYTGLQIIKIFGYGGVGWVTPSNLAKYGRMYTFDHNQNVAFPAGISAGGQNVVLNSDGRLSNARPASDVQPWAKALNKPVYSWNEITSKPSWISDTRPSYSWDDIQSKPTSLSGFGLKIEVDNLIAAASIGEGTVAVTSVNNKSGAVVLGANDITGLSSTNLWSSGDGSTIDDALFVLDATLNTHRNASNPHGITKSTVGLGSVINYGVATQAEAEAGTVDDKYMTPLKVKQAIAKLGGSGGSTVTTTTVLLEFMGGETQNVILDPKTKMIVIGGISGHPVGFGVQESLVLFNGYPYTGEWNYMPEVGYAVKINTSTGQIQVQDVVVATSYISVTQVMW